jgi:hypothetical protein
MTSLDAITVIIPVAVSCGVALVGWPVGARERRRGQPEVLQPKRRLDATRTIIAICAAVAVVLAPVVAVLWVVVALNFTLGRREDVPFSTYAMFSRPERTTWALRFEDGDGKLVPIGKLGLAPHTMRKLFTTELQAALRQGIGDVHAARRRAATPLAVRLERHRPPVGPLATSGITIVLVEYSLAPTGLVTVKTPIMETSPP